jgi:hypothetical protein
MVFPTRRPRTLLAILIGLGVASSASAQQRTFVSSAGSDLNAGCPRTAPCRSFQVAIDAVAAGGEVVALDSAGYGPFTIGKAITVTSEGVHAAITSPSGTGVLVLAGSTDRVILRNLRVIGADTLGQGIDIVGAGVVHVENVVVTGFSGYGIRGGDSAGKIFVKDTVVRDCGGGLSVNTPTSLDRVRAESNDTDGIVGRRGSRITARHTVASGNVTGAGFFAEASGANGAVINMEDCVSTNNNWAIQANNASGGGGSSLGRVYVSNSVLSYSSTATLLIQVLGSVVTFGNNRLVGNAGGPVTFSGSLSLQ